MTSPSSWDRFRTVTRARIGLERSGDSLATKDLLEFQVAHAAARDAVHGCVDFDVLETALTPLGPVVRVHNTASDRTAYLRRPDLGRRLDEPSRIGLAAHASPVSWDVVFVIADGLSAVAVNDHAVPFLCACLPLLSGWSRAPFVLAEQGRVALVDEIGAILNARLSVILIGERPGLSVANSLGLYLTWGPKLGRKDAERNCISNIHADGLSYDQAAAKLVWLLTQSAGLGLSGVALKDNSGPPELSKPVRTEIA